MFNDALGELRAVVGIHIALLSAKFGIDVEDDPASIFPAEVDDVDDSEHAFRDWGWRWCKGGAGSS
jgi:hypothetical protein